MVGVAVEESESEENDLNATFNCSGRISVILCLCSVRLNNTQKDCLTID